MQSLSHTQATLNIINETTRTNRVLGNGNGKEEGGGVVSCRHQSLGRHLRKPFPVI